MFQNQAEICLPETGVFETNSQPNITVSNKIALE
jgi:hypothetical protein